jgi:hypothetical protein
MGLEDVRDLMSALLDGKCHAGCGIKGLYFHFSGE